ncbi:PhoD-like phosphatase-domain-containing protein [Flagelloscypha sp. PMI_526]|nr:PhoD-like phosphatase-domain-containing protein [Flagelloscypha sp. PMI_526]
MFCADLVLHPLFDPAHDVVFTRIGAVSSDYVKIAVRYPASNASAHSVRLLWRESPAKSDYWRDGPLLTLTEEKDWVATTKLAGLWPKSAYEYTLASTNRTLLPYPKTPIQFHTFPDPRLPGSYFRFLASSCTIPNFPYVPYAPRTMKGYDHIAAYLDPKTTSTNLNPAPIITPPPGGSNETATIYVPPPPPTEFLIDFIYADVPYYAGDEVEAYQRLYRRNYNSPSFRKVYEKLPMLHTYDDHEIINNFAGKANDSTPPYPSAVVPFKRYNADANPESHKKDTFYYSFNRGDVAFFVLDTRRYRSDVLTADEDEKLTMLGEEQLTALHSWLGRVNSTATFKFIVSSIPFTSLWGHEAKVDTWRAYPDEKESLLATLHSIPNVFILSGDRHEFAHIQFTPSHSYEHVVQEISTSPLNMFWVPFIRTLTMASEEMVTRENKVVIDGEVVTENVEVPKERVLKYIASGSHKFSAIEVDTRDPEKPTLRIELVVNGKPKYNYEVVGVPVNIRTSASALGAYLAGGLKDAFDKFGFQPTKWF